MGIPQIIYLFLNVLGLGVHLAYHGKPKDGKYNFWGAAIVFAIEIWILKAGGFF